MQLLHAPPPVDQPAINVSEPLLRVAVAQMQALRDTHVLANPHEEPQVPDSQWAAVRHAAVLLAFVRTARGLRLLLTERSPHIRYGGHIAFPGGTAEPGDHDPIATALRETEEEVGLAPSSIDIVGQMPRYYTHARYCITGVIGLMDAPLALRLDPGEVASAEEKPVDEIFSPAAFSRRVRSKTPHRANFLIERDGMHIGGPTVSLLIHLYAHLVTASQAA